MIGLFALIGCKSQKVDLSDAHPDYITYLALKDASSDYCSHRKIPEPCENTLKTAKQHNDLKFPDYSFQGTDILPVYLNVDAKGCVYANYGPFKERNIFTDGPWISVYVCGKHTDNFHSCRKDKFVGAHAFEYNILECCTNNDCSSTIRLSVESNSDRHGLLDGLLQNITNQLGAKIQ